MSSQQIESLPHAASNEFNSEFVSIPVDITPKVYRALSLAFSTDSKSIPVIPITWTVKTRSLLNDSYNRVSPLAQRVVHFFSNLGNSFPDCSTLEIISRFVLRARDFDPDRVMDTIEHLQERSPQYGNPTIFEFNSALLIPSVIQLLQQIPSDEKDILLRTAALVPPLLFASISFQRDLKIADIPSIWNEPGQCLTSIDAINAYIDPPLRETCRILNQDLGIRTYWSSANMESMNGGYAYIYIKPEDLSDENLEIARKYFLYNGKEDEKVCLKVKVNYRSTGSEIGSQFIELTRKFKSQK